MSTLNRLAPRDLERLSAYVDGALPPREQASVEARLAKEADLRLAVDELRAVKAALASLPERRVPRSFALRPSDVTRRSPSPAFGYLRFATVLASILFVATSAVRSIPFPLAFGAAAPQSMAAAEDQEGLVPSPGTPTVGAELRAEAPVAATALEQNAAPGLAGTPMPEEACPECPSVSATQAIDDAAQADALRETAPSEFAALPVLPPLAVAQWVLGLSAIVLAALTVRARRR